MITDDEDQPPLPAAAIVAINRGRLVEAIRLVREAEPGLGLAGAKQRVDGYLAREPMLQRQFGEKTTGRRRSIVRNALLFDLVILLGLLAWFLFFR